jgi:hypothetical protein
MTNWNLVIVQIELLELGQQREQPIVVIDSDRRRNSVSQSIRQRNNPAFVDVASCCSGHSLSLPWPTEPIPVQIPVDLVGPVRDAVAAGRRHPTQSYYSGESLVISRMRRARGSTCESSRPPGKPGRNLR